jgi:steroid 5-alpha reductase family enzyme
MLSSVEQWLYLSLLLWIAFSGLWWLQRRTNDAGVVDVGWSAGVGLAALWFAFNAPSPTWRTWLFAIGTILWSARLALYIYFNRVRGKPEDGRYQHLRQVYGDRVQSFFYLFFQAQAALVLIFALSPWLALQQAGRVPEETTRIADLVGAVLIVISILGESTADAQLARFRAQPENRGQVCQLGLWNYSRHPNYFFEWLHWWAYVAWAWGHQWWWLTLIAPALMLYFLFRLTGIPATEAQALRSRGDAYREYQRTTSSFIPWFKRTNSESEK